MTAAPPWLLPGGQPGRPISAYQLTERLRQLDIHSGRARSTALFQLASLSMRVGTVKRRLNPHDRRSCWRLRPTGDPG
jgi:hypothetical protein